MKIVFFSWMCKSNVNVSLQFIDELILAGHEISYFGFEHLKYLFEGKKLRYISYKKNIDFDVKNFDEFKNECVEEYIIKKYISSLKRIIRVYSFYKDECIDIVREINPDCIIKDNAAQHGKYIGYQLKIKTIGFNTMMTLDRMYLFNNIRNKYFNMDKKKVKYLNNQKLIDIYMKIEEISKQLCKQKKLPYITPIEPSNGEDDITIAYGGYPLNPYIEDNRVIFVRNNINKNVELKFQKDEEMEAFLNDSKPIIYIGSGSMIYGKSEYYSIFVRALWDKNYNVVMSIPDLEQYNTNLPSNFLIRSFVNQVEVLEKASLFISFGGFNSIYEAINTCTPMLIYPQMNDQFLNGIRVKELNIGEILDDKDINKKTLLEKIEKVINNNDINNNLKKIKIELDKIQDIEYFVKKKFGELV